MKTLLKTIILSLTLLFTACSTDLGEFSHETVLLLSKKTCCEAAVSTGNSIGNAGTTASRGWGSASGQKYPYDYIYIISEADDDYDSFSPLHVLNFPVVEKSDTMSTIDMCFKFDLIHDDDDDDDDDDKDVYVTVDDKTFKVDDCILSSLSDGKAKMDICSSITTPHGQKVYEPYGDKLFFSEEFEVEYEDGKLTLEVDDQEDIDITDGRNLEIPLNRFTSVINGKFLVSKLTGHREHKLSKTEFEKTFGDLKDWSMRIFLKNAPSEFTFADIDHYPEGDDIIALSEKQLPFASSISHYDSDANPSSCEGVGVEDTSDPYIFPMDADDSKTELCYSFYYTGKKTINGKPIISPITLCVPIYKDDELDDIEANVKYTITTVVDVDDFKKGLTDSFDDDDDDDDDDHKSRLSTLPDDFLGGHVIHIPYQQTISIKK